MLKKIKELTEKELEAICDNHLCFSCPLYIKRSQWCVKIYLDNKETVKNILEKEVEVENE